MRLLIVTASLEAGRDGVGDYSRRLAGALSASGVEARLLALHERNLDRVWEGDQFGEGSALRCLRLPAKISWKERESLAGQWIKAFSPDIVSIQFVTYGFHSRGLPIGIAQVFRRMVARTPVEVMFHELWCGPTRFLDLKNAAYGILQKRIILGLLRTVNPRVVHTQVPLYVDRLNGAGIRALLLPMFGNVLLRPQNADGWLFQRLREGGIDLRPATRSGHVLFCFFGALHPEWHPESLLPKLVGYLSAARKRGVVLGLGNMGARGEEVWERMSRIPCAELVFAKIGELPVERLSECLNSCDFGITTTPPDLIGKSTTAAAMFEHGLPVIVSRPPAGSLKCAVDAARSRPLLIWNSHLDNLDRVARGAKDSDAVNRVAAQFLGDIAGHVP